MRGLKVSAPAQRFDVASGDGGESVLSQRRSAAQQIVAERVGEGIVVFALSRSVESGVVELQEAAQIRSGAETDAV